MRPALRDRILQTTASNIKTNTRILRGDLFAFKTNVEPKVHAKVSTRTIPADVTNAASAINTNTNTASDTCFQVRNDIKMEL